MVGILWLAIHHFAAAPGIATPVALPSDDEVKSASPFHFGKSKWAVAGIEIQAAEISTIPQVIRVTGTLALNEDRLAQIFPQVDGVVHHVPVQFGQRVEAGQPLLVIDSQQIGAAKLVLIKCRLDRKLAEVDAQWQQSVTAGAQALIEALKQNIPLEQIETEFADRDLGDYRSQLISAYAKLYKSRADYQRLSGLSEQGVTAGKDTITAKAALDADRANMQALLEQIKFSSRQMKIASEQTLAKAETTESISETNLRILGVEDTASIGDTPPELDEQFSHYTITSPISGTIITKDVTFEERVDPASQLMTIADLSTLWLRANIYEQQVPLVEALLGESIDFRTASYSDRTFQASVFFAGSIIDPQTRTLPLTAIVDNAEGLLKAGMFVDIELPGEPIRDALVTRTDAILDSPTGPTLFVKVADEQFEMRHVMMGATSGALTQITRGLKTGESVVVEGAFFLKSEMMADQFADDD